MAMLGGSGVGVGTGAGLADGDGLGAGRALAPEGGKATTAPSATNNDAMRRGRFKVIGSLSEMLWW